MPIILTSISDLKKTVRTWKKDGKTISFVPTMGNLHKGHLKLVEIARERSSTVVVSIFVNPLQFPPGTDYESYPHTLEQDLAALELLGVDLVFTPDADAVYPHGLESTTKITVPVLGDILCGAHRTGHFQGVCTVVAKLFNWVEPDVAVFGEKDFQQLLVIKKMVDDLGMPVSVIAGETVREPDGLAMSSRNQFLSKTERHKATLLYKQILNAALKVKQRINSRQVHSVEFNDIETQAINVLNENGFRAEYCEVRCGIDLSRGTVQSKDLRVFAAAWLGSARLIDNVPVN